MLVLELGDKFIINGNEFTIVKREAVYLSDDLTIKLPDNSFRYTFYCLEFDSTLYMNTNNKRLINLIRDKRIGEILT